MIYTLICFLVIISISRIFFRWPVRGAVVSWTPPLASWWLRTSRWASQARKSLRVKPETALPSTSKTAKTCWWWWVGGGGSWSIRNQSARKRSPEMTISWPCSDPPLTASLNTFCSAVSSGSRSSVKVWHRWSQLQWLPVLADGAADDGRLFINILNSTFRFRFLFLWSPKFYKQNLFVLWPRIKTRIYIPKMEISIWKEEEEEEEGSSWKNKSDAETTSISFSSSAHFGPPPNFFLPFFF